MSFVADEKTESNLYDFIHGDVYTKSNKFDGIYDDGNYGLSISCNRYYYLDKMARDFSGFKLAFRDPETNHWTKWGSFPGLLWRSYRVNYFTKVSGISAAVDVHRSVLPNEIVIESDYPTYEENCDASRIIGKILEHKGFTPHYYYSGNKSIHVHIFLDWEILNAVYWDDEKKEILEIGKSIYSLENFKKNFIDWLRKKMISCWDIKARDFDEDLIRASHLIRAELSRNKKGFKTFLGYTFRDLSPIPYICNETNRIYPKIAEIRLSQPPKIKELIDEFQENKEIVDKTNKIVKKNTRIRRGFVSPGNKKIRNCIKAILSNDFSKTKDGFKRGMFFLVNELRYVFGDDTAKVIAKDWNERMGTPIPQKEIDYRFKLKYYTMTCARVHQFLNEVGIEMEEKCKHKVYK